jgi:hypothetical protein
MWLTDAVEVSCPYCGEAIEIVVDLSESEQQYIEDCSVCCRPIILSVTVDAQGGATLLAYRDDD